MMDDGYLKIYIQIPQYLRRDSSYRLGSMTVTLRPNVNSIDTLKFEFHKIQDGGRPLFRALVLRYAKRFRT